MVSYFPTLRNDFHRCERNEPLTFPVKIKPEFYTILTISDSALLVHGIYDCLDNRQTDTTSAISSRSCLVHFIKLDPYFVQLILRNLISRIKYSHADYVFSHFQRHTDFFYPIHMIDCNTDLVGYFFFYPILIRPDIDRLCLFHVDFSPLLFCQKSRRLDNRPCYLYNVKPFKCDLILSELDLV